MTVDLSVDADCIHPFERRLRLCDPDIAGSRGVAAATFPDRGFFFPKT